jgi:predicted nucleotidyltransferase
MFQVKDFIATAQGLVFAVVEHGVEQGRVRCFLRYVQKDSGWKKVNTAQANYFLQQHYPQYLFTSTQLAAQLHGVAIEDIAVHYHPRQRLQSICNYKSHDVVERDCYDLMALLQQYAINTERWGITGSLLLGVQNHQSDIDLVCYDLNAFEQCRKVIAQLINNKQLSALQDSDWQQSYQRRDCDLSFADYVWHEQRKFNKALIHGRKFDISCVTQNTNQLANSYQKKGSIKLRVKVIDASYGFAYPAQFMIEHDSIHSVVCFTASYTGQALTGELIEVSGLLEQANNGEQRIVVGSSREAGGEYIKVIGKQ